MRTQQVSLTAVLCLALSLSALASDTRLNQLPPTTFDQIAKLIAPDGQANDRFGYSVAIDGSTIVVGKGSDVNTAFVYENNSGTVTQVAELTPSDGMPGDIFGLAVAISGNTIVISSPHHLNHDPQNYGSIYVYVEPAGGWTNMTETAELNLAQANSIYNFSSVAISGGTVVATGGEADGAVVWVEPSGGWVSSSKPNAELIDTAEGTLGTVAISGNVIVASSSNAYQFGVTFVYVKPASGWNKIGITETARLVGTSGGAQAAAIAGNTVAAIGNGGVYVFVKPAGGWADVNQTAFLTTTAYAVSVSGGTIVTGNPYQLVGVNPEQGAAFVFEEPAGGWKNTSTANAELVASDGNIQDELGTSVAVSGGTVVAGAPQAEIGTNYEQGAAYVFAQQ